MDEGEAVTSGTAWAAAVAMLIAAPLLLAMDEDLSGDREEMVRTQIEARGVRDPRVLSAMGAVPRHHFVPEPVRDRAYQDRALPIGHGQTISQPYVVAVMTEAVEPSPGDRVLEIGTGSGYQAAVLSRLVAEVHSIEIIPELADAARQVLGELGYENVSVVTGDGYLGLPDLAPFDGIVVTAAPEKVPPPIPVGTAFQELRVLERTEAGIESRTLFPVRFVPFTRGPDDPSE
jgi:protein-L-isoaspartate(D-aspartate) O-methyltransferase